MTGQLDIFDLLARKQQTPAQRERKRRARPANVNWDADAKAFFESRPDLLLKFFDIAHELIDEARTKGRNQIAAKHVWEELRLCVVGVKLNNNHVAYASRALRDRHPSLASWFRERRSA